MATSTVSSYEKYLNSITVDELQVEYRYQCTREKRDPAKIYAIANRIGTTKREGLQ